jgi:hypothetical protein
LELSNIDVTCYGDDTLLVIPGKSRKEIIKKTRNAVMRVEKNLEKAGLKLMSLSKTEIVLLHGKELTKYEPPILNFNVGGP